MVCSFEVIFLCFGFAALCSVNCLRNVLFSQPVRSKTRTNHDLLAHVFSCTCLL